jgi:single-strand DNA-binding protein
MLKLLMIGHLGADAIINQMTDGKTVINMNVAHSEKWTDKQGNKVQGTTWVQAAYWTDKTGVAQYLKKGTQVFLEGTPDVKMFQKRDGTSGCSFVLRVFSVQLLGSGKLEDAPVSQSGAATPTENQSVDYRNGNANDITEPISDLPF